MLKSRLNPEEQGVVIGQPTVYPNKWNRHRLLCGKCGEICYVDETTFRRTSRAILDGFDNPFYCQDCDEEEEVWRFAE